MTWHDDHKDARKKTGPKPVPVIERLMPRIVHEDRGHTSPCWIYTGAKHHSGYGYISRGGHQGGMIGCHQVTYAHFVGDIPEGYDIDHLCRVRECCNPEHLEAVTHRENCERGEGFARKARMTHCQRGHALEGANLAKRRDGRRLCRSCYNERQRQGRARRAREMAASNG